MLVQVIWAALFLNLLLMVFDVKDWISPGNVIECILFGSGFRNVPYDWINKQKSNQNWLRKEGEKFLFPGGGTMFPRGVGAYVDLMQDLIPEMLDGTVRTAIDTGCGVSPDSYYCFFTELII